LPAYDRLVFQMPLSDLQKAELFSGLEARGWTWREAFIYAPHGTTDVGSPGT
jgi:hypothetical protein